MLTFLNSLPYILLYLYFHRGFRVCNPAGLGVPIHMLIDWHASHQRITSCRKKPACESALYGACAPTFGFFRQLVMRCMRRSEGCQSIRNAQSRTLHTQKQRWKSGMYGNKKKTADCHSDNSAECNVKNFFGVNPRFKRCCKGLFFIF